MKVEDAYAVMERATSIEAVVPSLSRNTIQVEWKNTQGTSSITGTWADYLRMENWPLASGRFFTPTEQEGHRRVAVLGSEAATTIFPANIDPIGEELRIQSIAFEVIGVLGEKGGSSFFSRDNVIVIPMSTAQRAAVRHRADQLDDRGGAVGRAHHHGDGRDREPSCVASIGCARAPRTTSRLPGKPSFSTSCSRPPRASPSCSPASPG